MHQSYEIKFKHPADFRVSYRFYNEAEGGKRNKPRQGFRSDFWYHHQEQPNPNSIYMIWPEFEDEQGKVIVDAEVPVNSTGTARMWVLFPKMRRLHRNRIEVGLKGYFMEGSTRVAECEVIEIVGLKSNPIAD